MSSDSGGWEPSVIEVADANAVIPAPRSGTRNPERGD